MKFEAEITARCEDGVLERILRVCRHRGFSWQAFGARLEDDLIRIDMTGSSERALALLLSQLEKIDEVLAITTRELRSDRLLSVADGREPRFFSGVSEAAVRVRS